MSSTRITSPTPIATVPVIWAASGEARLVPSTWVCPAILGLLAEQLKDLSLLGLDFSLEVHQELDAHCPRQGKVYGVVLHPFRRSFRNRMAFRFEMGHAILAMGTAAGGCALRRSRKLGTCGGAALLSLSVQKPCDAALCDYAWYSGKRDR